MLKRYSILLLIACAACNNPSVPGNPSHDTTVTLAADTVPQTRTKVNSSPAAEYSEKVPDELNDWKFAVALYETPKTFQYILRVQYKELRITDSLQVPDLGFYPKVAIHNGKDPLSCIIGFLDKKEEFKEYKLVRIQSDQLKITTLKYYRVATYRTIVK